MSRLNFQRKFNIFNFLNNSIYIPINESETNAINVSQQNAENFTLQNLEDYNNFINGSNFIIKTYQQQNNLTDIYNNYAEGINIYDRILCKKTRFFNSVVSINSLNFKNGIITLFDKIKKEIADIDNEKLPSLIAFNYDKIYKYISNNFYTVSGFDISADNINYSNVRKSLLSPYITKNIPIYINYGKITGELINIMYKNRFHINDYKDDYLINFGPSHLDELYQLSYLVRRLEKDQNIISEALEIITNKIEIDSTIYFIVSEGDYFNNVFKFLYNYGQNVTIYTLNSINYSVNSKGHAFYTKNQQEFDIVLDADYVSNIDLRTIDSTYEEYLQFIINTKKDLSFNLDNNKSYIYKNAVIINIPIAENILNVEQHNYGNPFNKAFDIMKIDLYNRDISNDYFVYIKTFENYNAEKILLETLIKNKTSDNLYLANKSILISNKIILSSYNNIEYTLRKLVGNDQSKQANFDAIFNHLYIMSSFNLEYDISFLENLPNFFTEYKLNEDSDTILEQLINPENNHNFETKTSIDYNPIPNVAFISNQKKYLAIIDCNFINYLINSVVFNQTDPINGGYKNSNKSLFFKIRGLELYNKFQSLEKFSKESTENAFTFNVLQYFFSKFIDDSEQGQIRYNKWADTTDLYKQHKFNNLKRIKTFSLYNINNNYDFSKVKINNISIDNNIRLYPTTYSDNDFQNLEKLITTIFYDNIILKDHQYESSDNTPINFNNFIDNIHSLRRLNYTDNIITIEQLFDKYPNLIINVTSIDTNNLTFNVGSINDYYNVNGTNNFNIRQININRLNSCYFIKKNEQSGTFKVHFEIQNIPNIYYTPDVTPNPTPNSDTFITLKSNEITATII